jgi:hypothetical protein
LTEDQAHVTRVERLKHLTLVIKEEVPLLLVVMVIHGRRPNPPLERQQEDTAWSQYSGQLRESRLMGHFLIDVLKDGHTQGEIKLLVPKRERLSQIRGKHAPAQVGAQLVGQTHRFLDRVDACHVTA